MFIYFDEEITREGCTSSLRCIISSLVTSHFQWTPTTELTNDAADTGSGIFCKLRLSECIVSKRCLNSSTSLSNAAFISGSRSSSSSELPEFKLKSSTSTSSSSSFDEFESRLSMSSIEGVEVESELEFKLRVEFSSCQLPTHSSYCQHER
eukprot:TRINITY_DN9609_c0_g1_i3.p1 TRINITY_DN9609_c0_g1~~TRINITY_DN9609_c0_g1_i3.p1  ORF type:complete len:161 (+),score=37.29 TRINITY_DN9609_c0_g1_i3:33-485(+)